jgi:hypothetical protein
MIDEWDLVKPGNVITLVPHRSNISDLDKFQVSITGIEDGVISCGSSLKIPLEIGRVIQRYYTSNGAWIGYAFRYRSDAEKFILNGGNAAWY